MSQEDAVWLASLRPWAEGVVRRLQLNDADCQDVVQEAFTSAAIGWAHFVAPDELPAKTARLRWIAVIVMRTAQRLRDRIYRTQAREPYELERAVEEVSVSSHEGPVAARELLRGLQGATTAERWRIWVSHEVDGMEVPEVARQEGRAVMTVYNDLRLARKDLAAALKREAATGSGPLVRRVAWARRKRHP